MKFNINFCNIRGLNANINPVYQHLQTNKPHFLFLSETQISPPINDAHLNCPGYTLHSNFKLKAGVCIYSRNDLAVSRLSNFDSCCKDFQLLWIKICLQTGSKVICNLYRSPKSPLDSDNHLFDHLNNCVEDIMLNSPDSEIIILGDFNVHNKDWLHFSSHTDSAGLSAESFAISNNFDQIISSPTRSISSLCNMLDLFLTTHGSLYDPPKQLAPIGNSDHNLMAISHNLSFKKVPSKKSKTWQFSKANWNDLRDYFGSFPWNDYCFVSDVSVTANNIAQVILDAMNFYIPF